VQAVRLAVDPCTNFREEAMTITSVASQTMSPPPSSANGPQALFKQLNDAISSGDLSGAQKAFAQIQQNAPAGAANDPNNPLAKAMSQIGDALSSGDLSKAQSALSSMQSQMKAHHGHHGHRPSGTDSQPTSTDAGTDTTASTDSTTDGVNILA
jgi:hypothetical protein